MKIEDRISSGNKVQKGQIGYSTYIVSLSKKKYKKQKGFFFTLKWV